MKFIHIHLWSRGLSVLFSLALLCPSIALATPGLRPQIGESTLEAFLRDTPGSTSYFPRRRPYATPAAQLIETEAEYTLMVFRDLGGTPYGLPVIISLGDFMRYKFYHDTHRLAQERLGGRLDEDREGEGIIDVKIPIRVPQRLSAITGEGAANLTIRGYRRIELSGLSQYTLGQAQAALTRTSRFPTINFEQEARLTVEGSIGDRILVSLEQDSERQSFDLTEGLRLQYKGDEDGIIETIEAGNTTLALPGTRLIGFSGGSRGGLFGIKTRGRVGAINFTVVTSQDKSSSGRQTFTGQGQTGQGQGRADAIPDYRYIENTYFFLDNTYRENFRNGLFPAPGDRVNEQSVRVFINDYNAQNDLEDSAIPGIAYLVWNNGSPDEGASRRSDKGVEEGTFHELDPSEFTALPEGYLIHNRGSISRGYTLAVAYQTASGENFGDIQFIPDPGNPDKKIQLKLIKARQQRPTDPTWGLAWRNVYRLGGRNVSPEGLFVGIFRNVPGESPQDNQEGRSYLEIFGLDRHTNGSSESSPPDRLIDIGTGNEIPGLSLARGHLVFPFLEPFGEEGLGAPDLEVRVPGIYNETNTSNRQEAGRYELRVSSTSKSTEYNLGFGGLLQDSEVVRLNNRTLTRDTDYTINYVTGRLRFIGDAENEVADPSSDLDISYQTKDQFGFGQSKSLLGVRLERPFDDQYSLIGMTLLYGSQSTASPRVRVGQEPTRTILWDANARFRMQPKLLSDLVNSIPLVNTQAPSSIDMDFEIAQSLPNPNTKNVAYIDDFEGALNSTAFAIGKIGWNRASVPLRNSRMLTLPQGRLTWYNPIDRDRASLSRIQPTRDDISAEQDIVDILKLRFDPARSNGFPVRSQNNENGIPLQSWAGIMRYVNGLDLSRSKFLELWIRGDDGHLHIDLGDVSERVRLPLDHPMYNDPSDRERFPSGFRTEDKPIGGLPTGDDIVIDEEDIGLDGLTDAEEVEVFRKIFPGVTVPSDPSGDNFEDVDQNTTDILRRYPSGLNGTEGNRAERQSRPDTEDLNGNGFLDQRDSFIRYSVDLSSNRGLSSASGTFTGPSMLVPGTESDLFPELGGITDPPWRLLRIPLKGQDAPRTFEGSPDTTFASEIDFVRVWFEHNDTTSVEIYTFSATGSEWQEDPVAFGQLSGDFQVSTIGTNNSFYESPPGLEREIDPTTGIRLSENSLVLEFVDLYPGESISASRSFANGEDYTEYGVMTLFLHGGNPADPTYSTNFSDAADSLSTGPSPIEFFMRFAPINDDSLNYYEYRSRVYRGWAEETNTVRLDLEVMSQLKGQLLGLQATEQVSDTVSVSLRRGDFLARYDKEGNRIEIDVDGRTYIVRGNPALASIRAFTVGIRNRGDEIFIGENEVWMDELRVDDIRKKPALSALADTRITLADLGNLTVNLERRSGDFQDLQGRASGNTTTRFNFDSQFNIDKFFPKEWNTSMPVRFSYNRYTSSPRIRPGSDIVLTPEQKINESDVRSQTRFTLSLRKRPAREDPSLLSRILFDKASTSLNYSSDASTTGAITQRRRSLNENLNGNMTYNQVWSQREALAIFKWVPFYKPLKEAQFFYLPSSINYNLRFNRGVSDQTSFRAIAGDTSNVIDTVRETFNLTESYAIKLSPFRSLNADYSLTLNRDLRNGYALTQLQFGREISRNQSLNFRFTPRISNWITVNPSYSATYTDRFEIGGERVQYGSVRRGLTVNNQQTANARINLNLPSLFQRWTRKSGKDDGFSILQWIGKVGGRLQNVTSSVSQNKSNNLFGLTVRPSLAYQFGFQDTIQVPIVVASTGTRTNASNVRRQAQVSSGIRLPLGLNFNTSANYSENERTGNTLGKDDQVIFPKFDASWRGLERVPLIGWFWVSSNATFGYQESRTRRGDGSLSLSSRYLTSDAREISYNPLFQWSARWKGDMNTTFSRRQSRNDEIRYQRNVTADTASVQPTLADRLIGTTLTENGTLQADVRYSLRGRFQRTLDLTLSFSRNLNTQTEMPRSAEPDVPAEPIIRQNSTSWSVSLGTQYAFSSRFTGGTTFRHERRKDHLRDLTNVTWDFRFWGEIGFQ